MTVREYVTALRAAPGPKHPSPQDRLTVADRRAWLFRVRRANRETQARRAAQAPRDGQGEVGR